jgi:hypothetical protein
MQVKIAYVTKWALTRGILVFRDVECSNATGLLRVYRDGWLNMIGAQHWSVDEGVARSQVEVMRTKALETARKKVARLEKFAVKVREMGADGKQVKA